MEWGFIHITTKGIQNAAFISVRIVCLIVGSSLLTYTTTPTALTDAIESLLRPLRVIGVNAHELAMMMTIALRFIPTLMEETGKIMAAQKARGADMESGNLLQRVRALVPIIVPLLSRRRRAHAHETTAHRSPRLGGAHAVCALCRRPRGRQPTARLCDVSRVQPKQ